MRQWHTLPTGQVLKELSADPVQGLSHPEAAQRLQRHGVNRLDPPRARSPLLRFLDQMKDPMILVLLGAAVLSLVSSRGADWVDSLIILVIVAVNACISISQESNAERALAGPAADERPQGPGHPQPSADPAGHRPAGAWGCDPAGGRGPGPRRRPGCWTRWGSRRTSPPSPASPSRCPRPPGTRCPRRPPWGTGAIW